MKYDADRQKELFEELIRQKYRLQFLAGFIQNNWNEYPPESGSHVDFYCGFGTLIDNLQNIKEDIMDFYYEAVK